jgi:glucokinase
LRRVIGVDLGGTKLLAGVLDEQLEVHARTHRQVFGLPQDEIVESVVDAIGELRDQVGDVDAVGFGIPCLIDQRTGVAVMAVNLDILDFPFRDTMRELLGLPVFIDNDGNVMALVEQRFGAGRGAEHVIGLTLGTGVGGGIVIDGHVFRGSMGAGAELGHMVIDADGPPCQGQCPNHGCLETFVSGTAVAREAQVAVDQEPDCELAAAVASGQALTGELVTTMALGGEEVSRMVLGQVGRMLGVGLSNFVNIFNPEVIVVGGGVMAAGDLLLEPARAEMQARALAPNRDLVRVVGAKFGPEAGMLGAGVLAFDELDLG